MKTLGDSALGQVGRRLAGQLYVDRDRDHRNSVFLAGSGRSGTTWVADIINYRNEYRYIFEPFHRHKVPICAPFKYRQYLRPDDADPTFREPARRILTGDVRNLWADKYNRKRVSSRRLLKDVRANLFLKWMNVQFPGMPIVLLLRHPCAVASSRLKVDWQGGADLRQFLAQPRLVEDHLAPFRDVMAGAEDDYARMIFFWCVENYVPLRQFSPGQVHVVFYEALCMEPGREIERLFAFLGVPFDPHVLRSVARPSSATRKDSAIVSGDSLIGGWTKHLSSEQVTRALEILELFELDRIYGRSPTPTAEVAEQAFSS